MVAACRGLPGYVTGRVHVRYRAREGRRDGDPTAMLLNRVEFALMNNPVRAAIQKRFEARRLARMGGVMTGGRALEIGCGRGIGSRLVLDAFGADSVDAFDLDPRMVARARTRLAGHGSRVRLWVGDASAISVPDATYDAVFDFGIIHHVPEWRRVLTEVHRVLRPGGRFYAEEVLQRVVAHPLVRCLVSHPQHDRFDSAAFERQLRTAGLEPLAIESLGGLFAWFVARKPATGRP